MKLTPETMGWLHYTDRRGGTVSIRGAVGELAKRLPKLRRPAKLTADGDEEPIGGCERTNVAHDDQRLKWNWWVDSSACRVSP